MLLTDNRSLKNWTQSSYTFRILFLVPVSYKHIRWVHFIKLWKESKHIGQLLKFSV